MKSELKTVAPTSVDRNPHRDTGTYPYDKTKLNALINSMRDVGCWEGIIVRPHGRRYQAAFGHHRLEAARQLGLSKIPVIVRDLSDEDMLKFMGRENGEDYRAQFLVLLETWDAAAQHLRASARTVSDKEVASFLGWTRHDERRTSNSRASDTASACAAASKLIAAGHMTRKDLEGLTVFVAKELATRAHQRIKQVTKLAKEKPGRFTDDELEEVKADIGKGAKITAKKVREERVLQKDIRAEVDHQTHRAGVGRKKQSPLFNQYAKTITDSLSKMLRTDAMSDKLGEVVKAIPKVELKEDYRSLALITSDLERVGKRAFEWQAKIEKRVETAKAKEATPTVRLISGGR
jgi:ParB/RepB/Spo0J family partition protein